ncbi:hypothetical protein QYE76_020076 [Lolium multiflorum]|uniref:Uncharacterized protein n=1 Tax=Lolium multiflorum TaxID=4521 RepID=A0AAD8R6Z4_LOLMU|nr:hypothetical protein QYE76_020076 [Lolium multiflorum]
MHGSRPLVRSARLCVDVAKTFRASARRPSPLPTSAAAGPRQGRALRRRLAPLSQLFRRDIRALPILPEFKGVGRPNAMDYGVTRFDHVSGNNPELAPAAACIASFIGFHEFSNFTAEYVGMAEKGLSIL